MKKIFTSLVIAVSLIFVNLNIPFNAMAELDSPVSYYEYYDNGYYAIITINVDYSNASKSTISGSKTYDYKDASNQLLWSYTVYGTYSYNGYSAACTYDDDSYDINNTSWHIDSHSHDRSGNTAYGTVTMKKKVLGITVDTVTKDVNLSCSPNGTLY